MSVADALDPLRARLAELSDLGSLASLADWDMLVTMPAEGAAGRAHQLGTLTRIVHERAVAEEIGGWLQQLDGADLDPVDADLVRVARRDWERARRIPPELAVELAEAHASGQQLWQRARAQDDFAAFEPALARNVELARVQARCLAADGEAPYDALLDDYDFGLTSAEIRRLLEPLASALQPRIAEAAQRLSRTHVEVPVATQDAAVRSVLEQLGVDSAGWRLDVSAHPFSTSIGPGDNRITTRYQDGDVESLLSVLHEYGHALYERQIDPALGRTNLDSGASMSIHESQSKLWENHVARSPAFAEVLAAALGREGFAIGAAELHVALIGVEPGLIRVNADPLTYPLHILLRFELESALISGELAVSDLPAAWRDGMRRLLGVEVPSDALGCMQDVHWSAGAFGYFPSYALGCLIAAQLWETLEADLGPREDDLRVGEVDAIKRWLGQRIHRFGRRLDTLPLVEQATGRRLEVDPFLRYVDRLTSAGHS
ncbi:MAG: carboxypeptidase M32 [Solirubrobacteraceae bacterium]